MGVMGEIALERIIEEVGCVGGRRLVGSFRAGVLGTGIRATRARVRVLAARRLIANRNWFVPIFDSLLFANESVFGIADTIA